MNGLYKLENNDLLYAATAVYYPDGSILNVEDLKQSNETIDGWKYFETEEDARQYYNLQPKNNDNNYE